MKFKVRFLFEDNMLMIKFNSNRVNSKWLNDLTSELEDYISDEFGNTPNCNVEVLTWSTDNTGEGITFLVDCDTGYPIEEIKYSLYTNFREHDLFWITDKEIDNFTYKNNKRWTKLIDKLKENMSDFLYPILDRIKIELIEE